MTPTLLGRIQTRLFLLATVGSIITLLIVPILPVQIDGQGALGIDDLAGTYALAFTALAIVTLLGAVVWEPLYHLLQQFRWEKDWPTPFGLLTGINEGVLAWYVINWLKLGLGVTIESGGFALMFSVIWIGVFLFANGPMRVVFLRWRFRGGRIL